MIDGFYDQRIKDFAARASMLGPIENADCIHDLDNFLCGDRITLELTWDDAGRLMEIGGKVRGCLLVQAAAAMIAEHGPGMTTADLLEVVGQASAHMAIGHVENSWADLDIFTPVHAHKHRHDCVLLPFQALAACLEKTNS